MRVQYLYFSSCANDLVCLKVTKFGAPWFYKGFCVYAHRFQNKGKENYGHG